MNKSYFSTKNRNSLLYCQFGFNTPINVLAMSRRDLLLCGYLALGVPCSSIQVGGLVVKHKIFVALLLCHHAYLHVWLTKGFCCMQF